MERLHTRRRTRVFLAVTRLGSMWFLLPAALAAAALLLRFGQGRSARLLGVAMLGAWLASPVGKRLFQRKRPDLWPALTTEKSASFPSQHSLMAAVFFGGVGAIVMPLLDGTGPRLALLFALALALIVVAVAFSRVYLGAHWATDVIAGVLIGLLWLALCMQVLGTSERPHKMLSAMGSCAAAVHVGPLRAGESRPLVLR